MAAPRVARAGDVVAPGLAPATKRHQHRKQKRDAAQHIGGLGPKAWAATLLLRAVLPPEWKLGGG